MTDESERKYRFRKRKEMEFSVREKPALCFLTANLALKSLWCSCPVGISRPNPRGGIWGIRVVLSAREMSAVTGVKAHGGRVCGSGGHAAEAPAWEEVGI